MIEITPLMYLAAMLSLPVIAVIIAILGDLKLIEERLAGKLIESLLIPCLLLSALAFFLT